MDPNWANLFSSLVKDYGIPEAAAKHLLSLQKSKTSHSTTPNPEFQSAQSSIPHLSHPTPAAKMANGTYPNVAETQAGGLNVEPITMILPEGIENNPDDVPLNVLYLAKADEKRGREKSASSKKEKEAPVTKKTKTFMADTPMKTQHVPCVEATSEDSTKSHPKGEQGFGVGDVPDHGIQPSSTTVMEENIAAKISAEVNVTEENIDPTGDVAAETPVESEDDVQVTKEMKPT